MRYKKSFAAICICFFVIVLALSACTESKSIVEPVLKELAQPSWNGRQVGTDGNQKAAEYLADILKKYGYLPFEGDDYYHTYQQIIPDVSSVPSMKITYSDNSVEVLEPGLDFAVNRGLPEFSVKSEVVHNPVKNYSGSQIALYDSIEDMRSSPADFDIIMVKSDKFGFSANGQSIKKPYPVLISPETYNKLLGKDIAFVEIAHSPKHNVGYVSNVVGVLKGTDSKKAWILSAHFDGTASYGKVLMTSAYDNGSGTAALAEIARQLGEYAKRRKLKNDIIICFFNGEETGISGSKSFIYELRNRYEEMYNINIDCVGGKNCGALAMKPYNEESRALYDAVTEQLKKHNIAHDVSKYYGASDHSSFTELGIPVLVFGQVDVFAIAHSPDDKIENLDINKINELCKLITRFVIENDDRSFVGKKGINYEDDSKASNANKELNGIDWDAVRQEAERLTEGISLAFNEIFVFEYGNMKFQKSGYHPLHSEEELKLYYPEASLPDFSGVSALDGFTIENIDVLNTNNPPLVISYPGEQTGKTTVDLKQEDISLAVLEYVKDTQVFRIEIKTRELKSSNIGYTGKKLDGEYEGYILYMDDASKTIGSFGFADPKKNIHFEVSYFNRESAKADGKPPYLIKNLLKNKEQVKKLIDDFDFKNRGDDYFTALFGKRF